MARRDKAEFAEFVAARSAALHRAAYLMVGDQSLAQDLVQEALTKTYVAWPRLRDKGNAEAYTRKAITHTAISWFRRKGWSAERSTDQLGSLSPDARYFSSDANRQVYDVASGRRVSFDLEGRGFATAYEWLDDRTIAMLAARRPTMDAKAELLTCTVPEGT